MKRAIYIGKQRPPTDEHETTLSYGVTGAALYDESNGGKWDFRPDGLNICHLVPRSSLHFVNAD